MGEKLFLHYVVESFREKKRQKKMKSFVRTLCYTYRRSLTTAHETLFPTAFESDPHIYPLLSSVRCFTFAITYTPKKQDILSFVSTLSSKAGQPFVVMSKRRAYGRKNNKGGGGLESTRVQEL